MTSHSWKSSTYLSSPLPFIRAGSATTVWECRHCGASLHGPRMPVLHGEVMATVVGEGENRETLPSDVLSDCEAERVRSVMTS